LFLGYLVDVLFKNDKEAFKNTLLFLYRSVDLQGEDKVIALQSIDTLKTITCDQDLVPRIVGQGLLPTLVQMIVNSVGTIQNFEYLEFLQDFMSTYSTVLAEQVGAIAQAVISRIQFECLQPPNDNSLIFSQKCVNILVHITQNKEMMARYASDFERLYMPIFEYMVDPTKINFEDSILMIIKNFIKRTQSVSDIIFKVFGTLENVFTKNKNRFGDCTLLETINYYLIFGSQRILQDQGAIEMLIRMADRALFCIEPNITVNNAEGALLLQLILQIF
jgi:hypothetical protein